MNTRPFLPSFLPRLASVSYAMDTEGTTYHTPSSTDRVVDNRVEFAAQYRRHVRHAEQAKRLDRLIDARIAPSDPDRDALLSISRETYQKNIHAKLVMK